MATYYNHCQVGIVDASGNVNVIYPQTYASDVKVGTANSSIGITTSSTVQSLISALGSAATKNVGDLVTNSASSSSTSQAYSCNQINSKLNELNSKIHSCVCDTVMFNNLSGELTKNMGRNIINNPVAFASSSHRYVISSCTINANNNIMVGARMTISGSDNVLVSYLIMSK